MNIRVLCGMLFCVGNTEDKHLIEEAKYGINMDVGCMVDSDWLDCFEDDVSIRNTFINDYRRFLLFFLITKIKVKIISKSLNP